MLAYKCAEQLALARAPGRMCNRGCTVLETATGFLRAGRFMAYNAAP